MGVLFVPPFKLSRLQDEVSLGIAHDPGHQQLPILLSLMVFAKRP
jgi:hypothetical protein